MIMQEDGAVGKALWSINYIKDKAPEKLLVLQYKDLCTKPEETVKKIYKHFDIPLFKHRYTKLDQAREAVKSDQTVIRTDKVIQNHTNQRNILAKDYKKI